VGVEPPLVLEAERRAGQIVDVHPVEPLAQLRRRQQHHRHVELALDGVVALERRQARIGRQEEVAVLDEVELGDLAVHGEVSIRVLDHLDPESADLDVQRGAELEADAGRR
jgi:hypothetical protein